MLARTIRSALVALVAGLAVAAPAHAAPDPAPPPEPDVISAPTALIQIPAGCPVKPPADVAFTGTVLAKDGDIDKGTVRFRIDQVRAGSATPFEVGGLVDVRYGPDSQYLDVDAEYLVSAAVDPSIGALASKVTPDAPLFGGDAVVGLEDTEVECPVVDDPVQTINLDGTPVETGLLTPMLADKRLLLATLGVPAAIAGVALVGLVLARRGVGAGLQGILALGRAAVSPAPDHRAARVRHHASALDPAYAGDDDLDDPGDGQGRGGPPGGPPGDDGPDPAPDGGADRRDDHLVDA